MLTFISPFVFGVLTIVILIDIQTVLGNNITEANIETEIDFSQITETTAETNTNIDTDIVTDNDEPYGKAEQAIKHIQTDSKNNVTSEKIEDKIEKIEYENELRAISEILGIELLEVDDKTLDTLKDRLMDLINKAKHTKEDNNCENNNILIKHLESALDTLKHASGTEALHDLRLLRDQLEDTAELFTDDITSIMKHFKPKINLFEDAFGKWIKNFLDQIADILSKLKTEPDKVGKEPITKPEEH